MSIENPKIAASAGRRQFMKSLGIFALATAGFSIAHAQAAAVTLAWNANPETDITGYQLSYGTSPGVHPSTINLGTNTTASVPELTEGATYYFVVSATNQAGLQSLPSSEVSYQVPAAPVNNPPVATSSSVTTAQGTSLPITLAATDANGNTLTFAIVNGPAHGTLGGTAPNLSYSPAANFSGTDQFTFRANDGTVDSATATISITVTPTNSLPLPWAANKLGTGNLAGTTNYSAGVYTIAGSGALGGTQDAANFAWQTLSGDGEITARISKLNDTGSATRVGVMIRESLAANSRQAFIGVNNTGAFRWLRRTTTGGSISTTTSKALATSNQWVRLVRTGDTLTSYKSANGTTWTKVGASTVTLPTNCYIGLAVSSGSNTVLNTSQFSDIRITP